MFHAENYFVLQEVVRQAFFFLSMETKIMQLSIQRMPTCLFLCFRSFSSPEVALLLVTKKNRNLWAEPTPEVFDSQNSWQI